MESVIPYLYGNRPYQIKQVLSLSGVEKLFIEKSVRFCFATLKKVNACDIILLGKDVSVYTRRYSDEKKTLRF